MRGVSRAGLLVVCAVVCGLGGIVQADVSELPFKMTTSHLNIVFSVSDADAVHKFYGEILGLKRIPDLKFPGETYMIRYLGGETEVKFIVTGQDLPKMEGGTRNARGIRLLALLLKESERAGILERLEAAGLDAPEFTKGGVFPVSTPDARTKPYEFQYGMVYDYDGNQVEVVFLDENAPAEKFKQVQIGLAVSDMGAMDAFMTDVLGWAPAATEGRIHRYDMGVSQVKFWEVDASLPAWNKSPFEGIGYNLVQSIVPDVDLVRETVLARGGKIHTEPFALGKLATIMFVEGPDGILFEFAGPLLDRLK